MNDILRTLKNNSKRLKNLNYIYLNKFNKITKYPNVNNRNNFGNSKFIIIQSPTKKKLINTLPKWLFKFVILCSIGAYSIYNSQNILNYLHNFKKKNLNENVKNYLNYLLRSTELKEGGIELLDKIFQENHSKEATVVLLNNLFQDERVKEESKKYGVNLFNDLLKEEEVKNEVKKLFLEILRMEEMKKEGISLLKYIIEKEESKDIMAQYFKVIFLRSDIIKGLANVLTDSAIYSMSTTTSKKKFAEFVVDVWSDANLRWYVIKKSLNFWQPSSTTVKNEGVETNGNYDKNEINNINVNNSNLFPITKEITSLEMINKNNKL